MKNIYLFVFSLFFIVFAAVPPAEARHEHGFMSWIFTPEEDDHDRPYLYEQQYAYDSDWEYEWSPADWAQDSGGAQRVIDGFYAHGVLTDQYIEDGSPVLEVGRRFLELSPRDQRRVVKFVVQAFGVDGMTQGRPMQIRLGCDCAPLGVYSQGQVQLH